MAKPFRQLLFAVSFLTIIPGGGKVKITPEDTGRSTAFYPVVGIIIGGGFFPIINIPHMHPFTTAVLLTIYLLIITRALHADGIIDTFDGFLSGEKNPHEILKIMKDSNFGALGVASFFVVYLVKIALFYEFLGQPALYSRFYYAIMLVPVVSRGGVAFAGYLFHYPEDRKGLGKDFFTSIGLLQVIISLIAMEILTVLVSWNQIDIFFFLLAPLGFSFWVVWGFICRHKIHGMTGDTIGAGIELSEIFTLLLFLLYGYYVI